jgi:hypothetical protein
VLNHQIGPDHGLAKLLINALTIQVKSAENLNVR